MKIIFLASKDLSWLWNLGFHFPKLDYRQWLKVHIFSIWEIQTSRRIQHVGFIVKQSVTQGRNCPEILGSPSSRQLVQLQLFSQIFEILDPPFNFILPKIVWIHELCFEVNCFHAFRKIANVWNSFGLWNLKFDLKMLSFYMWFLSLISEVYFSFSPLFWRWDQFFKPLHNLKIFRALNVFMLFLRHIWNFYDCKSEAIVWFFSTIPAPERTKCPPYNCSTRQCFFMIFVDMFSYHGTHSLFIFCHCSSRTN